MFVLKRDTMTVRYIDGTTREAVLLSRTEDKIRLALKDREDIVELTRINGTWVTDDCEPVQVSFAWEGGASAPVMEEDCICSPEMAPRLLRMLFSPEEAEEISQESVTAAPLAASAARV